MAFCENCGRPLNEGEVCNCIDARKESAEAVCSEESYVAETQVMTEPVIHKTAVTDTPSKGASFGTMIKNMWSLFVALIRIPVIAAKSFLDARDTKMAYMILGVQCVAVLLYALISGIKDVVAISNMLLFEKTAVVLAGIVAVIFKILFSLMLTAGVFFGIAGLGFLFAKAFKGKTSFKDMLCLSAINSLISVPFILLAVIVCLIINVSTLFMVATVFGAVISFACLDAICKINETGKFYTVLCTYASMALFIRIIRILLSFINIY